MRLSKERAAVMVKKEKGALTVLPKGIFLIGAGNEIVPLKAGESVFSQNGDRIEPTGRFYITAETVGLYHLVTDVF